MIKNETGAAVIFYEGSGGKNGVVIFLIWHKMTFKVD